MAADFLGMQNNIENYILRTDINPSVQLAINRAIAKYSKQRWWFDETTIDWATTQGTWEYAVPTIPFNIRQVDYMRITVNTVYYNVIQRDIQFIVDANVNNNQGQPTDWAFYEQKIYFYPVPQDTYTIRLFYQKTYLPLSAPTDYNDFTTIPEAEDLIEQEALRWLYSNVILDDAQAMKYRDGAREAWKVLNQINESMTGINGYIAPTEW